MLCEGPGMALHLRRGCRGRRGAGRRGCRAALLAGRLLAHMAPSCRVALWPVPHADVHSAPRPGSGRLSNIRITETISEEVVFSASSSGCGWRWLELSTWLLEWQEAWTAKGELNSDSDSPSSRLCDAAKVAPAFLLDHTCHL